jgi:Mor family transcriptional regulator
MTETDEWGKDPSVQFMRKVFKEMEKAQHELLKRLDIIPYDSRISRWREQALDLFERAWGVANRMGITMDEHTASLVYVHCLAKVMGAERINIPSGVLPDAKSVERIFKEVF